MKISEGQREYREVRNYIINHEKRAKQLTNLLYRSNYLVDSFTLLFVQKKNQQFGYLCRYL